MFVTVFQPDNAHASSSVDIYFNSNLAGTIGKGEQVSGEIEPLDGGPYVVVAKCGFYYASFHGTDDAKLEIQWLTDQGAMKLKKSK